MPYIYAKDMVRSTVTSSQRKRLQIAKPDILAFFESQDSRIYEFSHLRRIVAEHRQFWRLTESTAIKTVIEFLVENSPLQIERIDFPKRPMIRYTWGRIPTYELVLSRHPKSFLSHFTAVYLYDLTEQIPKTIYVNLEQPRKGPVSTALTQEGIDRAFKRPMRRSNAVAQFREFEVCLLSSMGVDDLGIVELKGPEGEVIRVTDLERTLIDITVRPAYAGGVFEVLKAFRNAAGQVSVNRLSALLKRLGYIYPYHQAIGFYLERAGVYDESGIRLLRQMDITHDFHLAHGMQETDYSKDWRLFFPKGF